MHFYLDHPIHSRPQSPQGKGGSQQDTAVVLATDATPPFDAIERSVDNEARPPKYPLCNGAFRYNGPCAELLSVLSAAQATTVGNLISNLPLCDLVESGTRFDPTQITHFFHHCGLAQETDNYSLWNGMYCATRVQLLLPRVLTRVQNISAERRQLMLANTRLTATQLNARLRANYDGLRLAVYSNFLRNCVQLQHRLVSITRTSDNVPVACIR